MKELTIRELGDGTAQLVLRTEYAYADLAREVFEPFKTLQVQRRHEWWRLGISFTATGPAHNIERLRADVDAWLDEMWQSAQW